MLRKLMFSCLLIGSVFWAIASAQTTAQDTTTTDVSPQLTWPRKVTEGDTTILVYQPQIDSWDGNQLQARAAVSVTMPGKTDPTFGVIWITASTDVDKPNRLVTLDNIQVTKANFPQDKAGEQVYLAAIQKHVPDAARVVPLDHLEAGMTAAAAKKAAAVDVKNDAPKIIFSKSPAMLVLIDGDVALRQVEGQKLMRVVNTRALMLLDQTVSRFYLQAINRWFESDQPTGPWKVAERAPEGGDALKYSLAQAKTIDLLAPEHPETAPKDPPTIYVSTTPAELIQTAGEPEFTPIAGTNLLYVKNTDSALFMYITTQKYYVLVSGRWFMAASMEGPWKFISGKELPPDFGKIPTDSPKANVLLSIPGTPQASEAVIANSIPQTATVTIAETHLTVAYDGEPKFVPVEGAQNMSYAVNTALPVIRIDDVKTYWCVQNGVWFNAPLPTGPWAVATTVPDVIYTMPVSCPIHYVTYVRIYGSSPTVVYVGYTPGYMGTCVTADGVVVYGTGYYYPAYVGSYWVGYPPTYGYGAGFACGSITGFAFGFAAGAIIGDCWAHPYWGPCWGYGHVDINTHSVYHNWNGGVTHADTHYSYNGWTGESYASGRASTFNPYSGRSSVGGYQSYVNRDSGDFDARRGGATYNPNTGVVHAGGVSASGNYKDGDIDVNRAGGRYNTNTGIGHYDGDVYASHDGNVYRHTDDGWQEHTDNGWENTLRSNQGAATQNQDLDSQRSSRDLGAQRFQGLQNAGGFSGGGSSGFNRGGGGAGGGIGGGGGGGFGGGGRGRR